jgi:hypothetical protein
MYRAQPFNRFHLKHDFVRNDNVQSLMTEQLRAIADWNLYLSLKTD